MREIITLHLGQAGVQMGHAVWELACLEHNVGANGCLAECAKGNQNDAGEGREAMFAQCNQGNFTPRALMIDLDPTPIDQLRTGGYSKLWAPANLISGREDAASNFARAYFSQSHSKLPDITDRLRKLAEQCESLQCFKLIYSANGGTGSGVTAAILEELANRYEKKARLATSIYPSPSYSEIIVEPYNAALHTAATLEFCDCVVLADNQAIHRTISTNIGHDNPGFSLCNRIIARVINAQFMSHKYHFLGQQRIDVAELLINLVPYPRIHFPVMAFAPFYGKRIVPYENMTATHLLDHAFDHQNLLSSISTANQPFISCALLFRGQMSPYDVLKALQSIKAGGRVQFVDWCPTGFKTGINFTSTLQHPNEGLLGVAKSSINMIAHNVGIKDAWKRTLQHFGKLYSKKAFVHWFVSEGMEEGEFGEGEVALSGIIQDYTDICKDSEYATGTNDDEKEEKVPETAKQEQQSNVHVGFTNTNNSFCLAPSKIRQPIHVHPRNVFAQLNAHSTNTNNNTMEARPMSAISSVSSAVSFIDSTPEMNTNCLYRSAEDSFYEPSPPTPKPRLNCLASGDGNYYSVILDNDDEDQEDRGDECVTPTPETFQTNAKLPGSGLQPTPKPRKPRHKEAALFDFEEDFSSITSLTQTGDFPYCGSSLSLVDVDWE